MAAPPTPPATPATPPQPPIPGEELQWPSDTELSQAGQLRASVPGIADCPEDIRHDLNLVRFLQQATEKLAAMVAYRRDAPFGDLAEMRDIVTSAGGDEHSLAPLPHSEELLAVLPLVRLRGATRDGLRVSALSLARLRVEDFDRVPHDHMQRFCAALLEQRSIALHRQSLRERRMAKVIEIRDITGVNVTHLALQAAGMMGRVKGVVSVVQEYYPEVIDRIIVFNAPSSFAGLWSVISSVMNPRMRRKVRVLGPAEPFSTIAAELDAQAMYHWLEQAGFAAGEGYRETAVHVDAGCQALRALWLPAGATFQWRVAVGALDVRCAVWLLEQPSAEVKVSEGHAGGSFREMVRGTVAAPAAQKGDTVPELHGSATAVVGGCAVLVLDNSYSWFTEKVATVTFDVRSGADPLPQGSA
eukprot:TRINITY_DN4703_c0_g1_i2.p1 TRINITY_DN4703_c0_g1~~TRINITY_DN4703_c0_g1_i2.p1  ORF type:complete len:415 (+),score=85.70 TRINITY_DN4703_c0_g1_i2:124-1368(+)